MAEVKVISLDEFKYEKYHVLSKSSLGQIMKAIRDTVNREWDNNDEYQIVFKPWTEKEVPVLIEKFEKMLVCSNEEKKFNNYDVDKDYNTRYINLGGKMPIEIKKGFHHKVKLHKGNMGPFIEAAFQRIQFILERDLPEFYAKNPSYFEYFEQLRKEVFFFRKALIDFKRSFRDIVLIAREKYNNSKEN